MGRRVNIRRLRKHTRKPALKKAKGYVAASEARRVVRQQRPRKSPSRQNNRVWKTKIFKEVGLKGRLVGTNS